MSILEVFHWYQTPTLSVDRDGKCRFGHESKNQDTEKAIRCKSKKKRKVETLTLTLREKGWRGFTWVQPPAPPPATGCVGAQQRAGSPANRSEPLLVNLGRLLHARARKGHHRQAARRRRALTQGSTRAGEGAGGGAVASFPGSMAAAVFVERENREGK